MPCIAFAPIAAPLAVVLALTLVGCGDDDPSNAEPAAVPVGTQVPSTTSSAPDAGGQDVSFGTTFGPPTYFDPVCDEGGRCIFGLSRTSTELSGDLEGSSVSVGAGTPDDAGGYVGTGIHVFTGTVGDCGDGVVVWVEQLASDGSVATGTWSLLPGSGPDGLDVTGSGTFEGTVAADGGGTVEGTGTVAC